MYFPRVCMFVIGFSILILCIETQEEPDTTRLIVGGHAATRHKYPFMAALVKNSRNRLFLFCGGTLAGNKHVLTAAHCVRKISADKLWRYHVVLGLHSLPIEEDPYKTVMDISSIVYHAAFGKKHDLGGDVAVVVLDKPVTFSAIIHPVVLPPEVVTDSVYIGYDHHQHHSNLEELYVGREATVAGWGLQEEDGHKPEKLQEAVVIVLSNQDCINRYRVNSNSTITDDMVCAAYPGKDSCQGDSGGPMLVCPSAYNGDCVQIGITSWGIGCASPTFPGVYTRLTRYVAWIRAVIHNYP